MKRAGSLLLSSVLLSTTALTPCAQAAGFVLRAAPAGRVYRAGASPALGSALGRPAGASALPSARAGLFVAPEVLRLSAGIAAVRAPALQPARRAQLELAAPRTVGSSLPDALVELRTSSAKLFRQAPGLAPGEAKARAGRIFEGTRPDSGEAAGEGVAGISSDGRPRLRSYFKAGREAHPSLPSPSLRKPADAKPAGSWRKRLIWMGAGAFILAGALVAGYLLLAPRLRPVTPPAQVVVVDKAPYELREDPAARFARGPEQDSARQLYRLDGHVSAVRSVAAREDGKAVVTVDESGAWKLWDAESGKAYAPKDYPGKARAALFADGGRKLILLDDDATLRVIGLREGGLTIVARELGGLAFSAFSPDARRLCLVTNAHAVHILDLASGKARAFQAEGKVVALASTDNGEMVLTTNRGLAKLWRIAGDAPPAVVFEKYMPGLRLIDSAVSRDGTVIGLAAELAGDQLVVSWRTGSEALSTVSAKDFGLESLSIAGIAATADGSRLAVLTKDGGLYLWTPGTAPTRWASLGSGRDASFTPDGETLIAADAEGGLRAFAARDAAAGPAR